MQSLTRTVGCNSVSLFVKFTVNQYMKKSLIAADGSYLNMSNNNNDTEEKQKVSFAQNLFL